MPLSLRSMLPVLAFACTSLLAHADSLEIVSARQTSPGHVAATVAIAGPSRLQPNELSLELDGARPVNASTIAPSATPGAPGWLVLCLDRSGSIGPAAFGTLKSALDGGLAAQGSATLGYKVAVVSFGTHTVQVLGFTDQGAQVVSAIDRLRIEPGGKTRLHDAIAGALATLRAEGEGRKRILVASDGKDEGSTLSAKRLVELAQQPPTIPIDALSFGALAPGESESLSLLAGATGGRFIQVTDPSRFGPAVRTLLAGNAPAPLYDVVFSYPASTDDRQAESVTLVYAAEGRPAVRQPLGITVAAQAQAQTEAPVVAPPPDTKSDQTQPTPVEEPGFFAKLMRWLRGLPQLVWWIAIALAVLLLALAWRMRARKDAPIVQPPPPPPPGDATVVVRPPTQPQPAPPRRSATVVGFAWPAPRPGQPTAILRGVSGVLRGQQYQVDKAAYRLGCAPDNDLVIVGDDFASGHHALLRYEANALYVEDRGSTNGSRLNGAAFKSATRSLSPGDELQFGHTTLEVLSAGSAGAATAQAHSGLEPRVR